MLLYPRCSKRLSKQSLLKVNFKLLFYRNERKRRKRLQYTRPTQLLAIRRISAVLCRMRIIHAM